MVVTRLRISYSDNETAEYHYDRGYDTRQTVEIGASDVRDSSGKVVGRVDSAKADVITHHPGAGKVLDRWVEVIPDLTIGNSHCQPCSREYYPGNSSDSRRVVFHYDIDFEYDLGPDGEYTLLINLTRKTVDGTGTMTVREKETLKGESVKNISLSNAIYSTDNINQKRAAMPSATASDSESVTLTDVKCSNYFSTHPVKGNDTAQIMIVLSDQFCFLHSGLFYDDVNGYMRLGIYLNGTELQLGKINRKRFDRSRRSLTIDIQNYLFDVEKKTKKSIFGKSTECLSDHEILFSIKDGTTTIMTKKLKIKGKKMIRTDSGNYRYDGIIRIDVN